MLSALPQFALVFPKEAVPQALLAVRGSAFKGKGSVGFAGAEPQFVSSSGSVFQCLRSLPVTVNRSLRLRVWLLATKDPSLPAEDEVGVGLSWSLSWCGLCSAQTVRATRTCDSRIRGHGSSQTLSLPTCEPRQPPCQVFM